MYVVAMKIMRDNDEAADVVQTCMTRIWEQRSSIPLPEDPAAWCNVVARREALNRLRNRPAAALEYTPEPEENEQADMRLLHNDTRRRLLMFMRRLPEKQYRATFLNIFRGLTPEETAEAMGESSTNVRQLLCRARKNLRTLYEKELW